MDSVLLAVWSVAYLVLFFGLRFQMDGGGMRPVPTFHNRESNYAALERDRARQSASILTVAAEKKAPPPEPAPEKPASAYWTAFRGPNRDGRYDQSEIRVQWPE